MVSIGAKLKKGYRATIFLIAMVVVQLCFSSCSKNVIEEIQQNQAENYFEKNILGNNFRVKLATDNGTDITAQFDGFTYVLVKGTLVNGPMTATKNGTTYNGTWAANADYSKLTISFTSAPPEFVFLNRDWKFTKKALPVMELAPWGTLEPKVLHMEKF
jgi:hypothetical protein